MSEMNEKSEPVQKDQDEGKPQDRLHVRPAGVSGLNRHGGFVHDEFHWALRGKKAIKTYRQMRDNDAVIGSIIYAWETHIQQAGVTIEAAEKDNPQAEFYKKHVEECLDDMSMSWTEMLSDILSMTWAGYSYHETVYKVRRGRNQLPVLNSKYSDGLIGWRKIATRYQETIDEWKFADDGGIEGAWQVAPPHYRREFLSIEYSLLFRTTSNKNNPEGRSLLRNAYRSWFFKTRIEELEAIGVERDMAGVLVFQVPFEYLNANPGSTESAQYEEFKKLVERARRGEYDGLLIPPEADADGPTGFKLNLLQSGGRRPMDVDGIIRRLDSRIALSVLGEAVLLGMQGSSGSGSSWSLASTKTMMFAVAAGAITRAIEDVFNRFAIPRLMELNGWPPELSPRITFGDLESEESLEWLNALVAATTGGLIVPSDALQRYIYARMGIELDEEPPSLMQTQDALGAMHERDAQREEQPELDAGAENALRQVFPIAADNRPLPEAA